MTASVNPVGGIVLIDEDHRDLGKEPEPSMFVHLVVKGQTGTIVKSIR